MVGLEAKLWEIKMQGMLNWGWDQKTYAQLDWRIHSLISFYEEWILHDVKLQR